MQRVLWLIHETRTDEHGGRFFKLLCIWIRFLGHGKPAGREVSVAAHHPDGHGFKSRGGWPMQELCHFRDGASQFNAPVPQMALSKVLILRLGNLGNSREHECCRVRQSTTTKPCELTTKWQPPSCARQRKDKKKQDPRRALIYSVLSQGHQHCLARSTASLSGVLSRENQNKDKKRQDFLDHRALNRFTIQTMYHILSKLRNLPKRLQLFVPHFHIPQARATSKRERIRML